MNTPENAAPEAQRESRGGTPAAAPATPATRPLYWSLRRELWENRSLYIAPLVIAGMLLLGSLISALYYGDRIVDIMEPVLKLDPESQAARLARPYDMAAILIIATSFLVAVFYCLDALYGERRERSILFWKSLPVSDLITVLSKASIPLVVLPLIAFVVILATQFIMLLIATAALETHGMSASVLWRQVLGFEGMVVLLYGLVVNSLWYAPVYGWLLMVSAWARRTTFLWAVLPPLALCVVEAIAFHTWHFASLLKYRLGGGFAAAFDVTGIHGSVPNVGLAQLDPIKFLGTPGLWTGLAVAAAFLAAAVSLRRYRGPI
jgi:ABC-2 type transport system permease protein